MRPRSRVAVSVLSLQIGWSTRKTSRVSISATGSRAEHRRGVGVEGRAPLLSVLLVPELGELLLQVPIDSLREGQRVPRLALLGERVAAVPRQPLVRRRLLARLGERDDGGLPSPSSRRLPRMVTRCTQKRAPFGSTRRYSPSPPPS